MKIKKTLTLIDYSQSFLVTILIFLIVALTRRAKEGFVLVLELTIGGAGIIIFLFRSVIVNRVIRKSPHPGLMYSVLEKLGYTQKLDLYLPDELLDEVYHPTYSTAEFLAENELKTEFSGARNVAFLDKGLSLSGKLIPWTRIYDWSYAARHNSQVIVNYYDESGEPAQYAILLGSKGMNKIDILLLFAHFKGKYGAPPAETTDTPPAEAEADNQ